MLKSSSTAEDFMDDLDNSSGMSDSTSVLIVTGVPTDSPGMMYSPFHFNFVPASTFQHFVPLRFL